MGIVNSEDWLSPTDTFTCSEIVVGESGAMTVSSTLPKKRPSVSGFDPSVLATSSAVMKQVETSRRFVLTTSVTWHAPNSLSS
jgi:hypothetical protein